MPQTLQDFDPKSYKIEDEASLKFLIDHNLFGKSDGKMKLEDALTTSDAPILFPKVISTVVREAMEPLLVATTLMQEVEYHYGQQITIGSLGAITAGDIPETGEYPERSPQMGGGTVTATIGKSGAAIAISDEVIRYSQFEIISMMLRKCGFALARWKETKAWNTIRNQGVTVFDNVAPGSSLKGVTTGRDASGNANGSLNMDDLFDAYAHLLLQGFIPDTVILHPFMWAAWVKDATLRAFALANGGGTYFAGWQGQPNQQSAWQAASQGGLGIGVGQSLVTGPSLSASGNAASGTAASLESAYIQRMTSAPNVPSYFNVPFRLIVSHLVPFDVKKKVTDIYMVNSSEVGLMFVDEKVTTEEFRDPRRDMQKIKLRERYGFGILNEGQAIGVLRNVRCLPNQVVLPAQVTLAQSGQVNPIGPTDSVL